MPNRGALTNHAGVLAHATEAERLRAEFQESWAQIADRMNVSARALYLWRRIARQHRTDPVPCPDCQVEQEARAARMAKRARVARARADETSTFWSSAIQPTWPSPRTNWANPASRHGTVHRYIKSGCRCAPCRGAKESADKKHRAKMRGIPTDGHTRMEVFRRDAGICYLCGVRVDPADWHEDHIHPLSRGGPDFLSNVAVSHPLCNRRKNDKLLSEIDWAVTPQREDCA